MANVKISEIDGGVVSPTGDYLLELEAANGTSYYSTVEKTNFYFLPFGSFVDTGLIAATAYPYAATVDCAMTIKSISIAVQPIAAGHDSSNYYSIVIKLRPNGQTSASDVTLGTTDTKTATGSATAVVLTVPIAASISAAGFVYVTAAKVSSATDFYCQAPLIKVVEV